MEGFNFALKGLLATVLIVGLMQISVGNQTIENKITNWFYSSSVPRHIRTAASGGALFLENSYDFSKEKINSLMGVSKNHQRVEKAER